MGALAGFCWPLYGQAAPAVRVGGVDITGVPEDWSHHHIAFANPGTEQEAIQNGHLAQWTKIVTSPLYVLQQLKRNAPVEGPAATDASYRMRWISESAGGERKQDVGPTSGFGGRIVRPVTGFRKPIRPQSDLNKDWSMPLGGPGLAAGHYPAKYSAYWANGIASCSDFVVFPTGAAGSGTQATIMAFNKIYDAASGGCNGTSLTPATYWAYNTGGTSKLSPVMSWDGSQVAFIQTSSNVASLVILKMANSGGAYNSPTTISQISNANNYKSCSAPCYYRITLAGSRNDSNSAPYYDYLSDTIYVGDDGGYVHKITGVFGGSAAPAEVATNWPIQVSTKTSPALDSPVYDPGGSNRIFVGDASGYLYSFTVGTTPGGVGTSGQLAHNTGGLVDGPMVDPVAEQVYAFIGLSGDGGNNNPSYINRFPAGTALSGGFGTGVHFPNGGSPDTTTVMRSGSFDNLFFAIGSGAAGNLYVCVNGRTYQVPLATIASSTVNTFNTAVSSVTDTSTCSSVTEYSSAKANTTLTAALGATGDPVVASKTGMAINDYLQIGSEIMIVTATTPTLTVTRAQLGTTAATHSSGAAVQDIQDWIYLSVAANGNVSGVCTGACLYNYSVTTGATTGAPAAGIVETGGTSGIIIDNISTTQTGAQQIYFNTLTGNNAVQTSQAAP